MVFNFHFSDDIGWWFWAEQEKETTIWIYWVVSHAIYCISFKTNWEKTFISRINGGTRKPKLYKKKLVVSFLYLLMISLIGLIYRVWLPLFLNRFYPCMRLNHIYNWKMIFGYWHDEYFHEFYFYNMQLAILGWDKFSIFLVLFFL